MSPYVVTFWVRNQEKGLPNSSCLYPGSILLSVNKYTESPNDVQQDTEEEVIIALYLS